MITCDVSKISNEKGSDSILTTRKASDSVNSEIRMDMEQLHPLGSISAMSTSYMQELFNRTLTEK